MITNTFLKSLVNLQVLSSCWLFSVSHTHPFWSGYWKVTKKKNGISPLIFVVISGIFSFTLVILFFILSVVDVFYSWLPSLDVFSNIALLLLEIDCLYQVRPEWMLKSGGFPSGSGRISLGGLYSVLRIHSLLAPASGGLTNVSISQSCSCLGEIGKELIGMLNTCYYVEPFFFLTLFCDILTSCSHLW